MAKSSIPSSHPGSIGITSEPMHEHLNLIGEVVELYENSGMRSAKIALRSVCVNIGLENGFEAHLGDRFVLQAELIIRRAEAANPADA